MSEIDRMLAANEDWAQRFPGSKDTRPARHVAIVSCMDSRMPLFQMLGLEVGEGVVVGRLQTALGVVDQQDLAGAQDVLGDGQ